MSAKITVLIEMTPSADTDKNLIIVWIINSRECMFWLNIYDVIELWHGVYDFHFKICYNMGDIEFFLLFVICYLCKRVWHMKINTILG